jgi:TetR/AcrR family transcriptional regulator, transcriptional repressor for nem operon
MARTIDSAAIPSRIALAGRDLFSRQGYNATGISEITALAGVPKGSFYNHYSSKEQFAARIVGQYAQNLGQAWDAMLARAPEQPLAALRFMFDQMIVGQEHCGSRAGCLLGNFAAEMAEASPICRAEMSAAILAWRNRLAQMLDRAQLAGEVRSDVPAHMLADLLWDTWEGALLRMKISDSVEPLRQSVDLLFVHLLRP